MSEGSVSLQFKRGLIAAACLAVAGIFGGCAAKPIKPVPLRAQLVASADVNPDASGRPSPIVVRLFALRTDGEFVGAAFFDLYEKEKQILGESLISREEFVLAPGEARDVEIALNAQARFLGVMAAYRDFRGAQWRAVTQAPAKSLTDLLGRDGLTLFVGKDAVTVNVKD